MKVLIALLLTLTLFMPSAFSAGNVEGEISAIGDATHIEFKGKSSWDYNLKTIKKNGRSKISLRIPALASSTVNQLKSWSGNLIREVKVNQDGPDGNYEVTFELKNPRAKAFDYLTDEPSRLVLDFYLPKSSSTKDPSRIAQDEVSVKKAKPRMKTANKKVAVAGKTSKKGTTRTRKVRAQRAPAGTDYIVVDDGGSGELLSQPLSRDFKHGIYDGADAKILRFRIKDEEIDERAIIASRKNIFLRFPVLDLGLPFLKVLWKNPPTYEARPKETEENKLARLLIVLFNEKKLAMFTKTLNFFREQYPNSVYNEIAGYLEADFYYHRWRTEDSLPEFENAMVHYRQMLERYPESPLAERTYLLMGYSYLERGDSLGALKVFQRFLARRPKTKFRDKAELAIGEAYLRLNRYKESLRVYQQVARTAQHERNKVEAVYLMGDASYKKGGFRLAIKHYKRALADHPEVWKSYPNAPFNLAESYFWVGDYKKSMDQFIEFLTKFPAHSYGGYAMTRLGELLEILGAPKQKVMGAFLESYFRYRATPGGKLARARILTARMPEMKKKELDDALKELKDIVDTATLKKTDQFVWVKTSDGFFARKDFDKATDVLLKYYQKNPTETDIEVFQTRIVRNIAAKIKQKVNEKDFIAALKEYARFKDSWLKRSKRLDIGYFRGKAFEQAGVYTEAAAVYRATMNRLYSILGTNAEKTRGTFEKLPKSDSLNLRLAAVSARKKEFGKANNYLREISQPDELSQEEQIELVELAAKVAEERGQLNTAKNFLKKVSDNWKGQPEMVSGPYIRLAELQMQSRKLSDTLNSVQKVINLATDTGRVDKEHHFKALKMKAEVLFKKGRKKEAVLTYKKVLDMFSAERELSSMRYQAGNILFELGDEPGAEKLWGPLQEKPESLWAKLAKEKTQNVKWRSKYKKYIDRIPAMEDFGGQEQ